MLHFEIANYADAWTPFTTKLDGRSVVDGLEISSSILFTWLNHTDKSHLLLSNNNILTANIGGNVMETW